MKMTFDQKLITGFLVCVLILSGIAIFSFKNSEKFVASNAWVDHTNQVLHEFDQILISSVDAETGERGYIITGDQNYLEPFNNSKSQLADHVDKVTALTKDNPAQQK